MLLVRMTGGLEVDWSGMFKFAGWWLDCAFVTDWWKEVVIQAGSGKLPGL
ncbi:MAG TPA: hypothetical protein VLH60_05050 [Sedimentisphaerales bacterium]|nr:hypothetical protein [Sedimentisphaerales bacterium]